MASSGLESDKNNSLTPAEAGTTNGFDHGSDPVPGFWNPCRTRLRPMPIKTSLQRHDNGFARLAFPGAITGADDEGQFNASQNFLKMAWLYMINPLLT